MYLDLTLVPIPIKIILMLFSHFHLDIPNGLVPYGFSINILYAQLAPHISSPLLYNLNIVR